MTPQPLRLGFLTSHGGSSMRAIVAATRAGELPADPRLVICNNAEAPALDYARAEGLPWRHISSRTEGSVEAADQAIATAMREAGVTLIVLSGYLRKLCPATLSAYKGRILNIHPALLPRHGGQGMYGRRVHEAVHAAGDAVTGATIHLVDGDYDHGPVLAQLEVPLAQGDCPEDIERKVMAVEPGFFVHTLRRIAAGELALPGVG
ncbi:MAG: phosphoribosylglycinamide formyltransferase [Caulobacteraceae bacterium]